MVADWSDDELRRDGKLVYLHILRLQYLGVNTNIRKSFTKAFLAIHPEIDLPKEQFGGSFDHLSNGIFMKDHNVKVTQKEILLQADKTGISPIQYIDFLVTLVLAGKRL